MPKETADGIRTTGVVFAIVLSILALETSSYLTRQANVMSRESNDCARLALANAETGSGIAREALALSGRVNDTVAVLTREYPLIEIRMATTAPVPLQSMGDLRKEDFRLYIKNRGNVSVSGLRVQMSAVSGMTHALDDPDDICEALASMTFKVSFGELLTPQGFALVDLRGPVLDYLQRIHAGFKFPDRVYHTPINVMATPMVGDVPVPAGGPNIPCSDQDLLQVRLVPALLRDQATMEITHATPIRTKVCSAPPDSSLAETLGTGRDTGGYSFVPGAVPPHD